MPCADQYWKHIRDRQRIHAIKKRRCTDYETRTNVPRGDGNTFQSRQDLACRQFFTGGLAKTAFGWLDRTLRSSHSLRPANASPGIQFIIDWPPLMADNALGRGRATFFPATLATAISRKPA